MRSINRGVIRITLANGAEEQFFSEDTDLLVPETDEELNTRKYIVVTNSAKTEFIIFNPLMIVTSPKKVASNPLDNTDIEYPEIDR